MKVRIARLNCYDRHNNNKQNTCTRYACHTTDPNFKQSKEKSNNQKKNVILSRYFY